VKENRRRQRCVAVM